MGSSGRQQHASIISIPEVQLIGSILEDDVATATAPPSPIAMPRPRAPISEAFARSISAPPQLSLDGSSVVFVNGEAISPEDPRLSPAYYAYYYSQRPIDPRLPPPLLDYSSWGASGHPPDAFKHMRLATIHQDTRHLGKNNSHDKSSSWAMEKSVGASMIQQDFPRTPSPLFPAEWHAKDYNRESSGLAMPSPYIVHPSDFNRSASADIEQLQTNMSNLHMGSVARPRHYDPAPTLYGSREYSSSSRYGPLPSSPHHVQQQSDHHQHYWAGIPSPQAHAYYSEYHNSIPQNVPPHTTQGYKPHRKQHSSSDQSTRATILHELRTNKHHHHIRLTDVIKQGLVAMLATDQNGSRFIQMQLEHASKSQLQELFEQLEGDTIRLSVDVFANYVIQKFFEHGTSAQRRGLANRMYSAILSLSMQMYGCRVVQKALEVIERDQQLKFVLELRGHIEKCVKDQNGNHVIQKCIELLPHEDITFVTDAFVGNVCAFSMHAYGCRVIQRLLEHCRQPCRQEQVLKEIMIRISDLIVDQFGNYVIQNIIERGPPTHRNVIIAHVKGHICELSRHKFASNVVEKCFAYGTEEDKEELVKETCGELISNGHESHNSPCPLVLMVKDPFGNYVIQKILAVVNPDQRNRLVETMRTKIPNLRKIAFGKHIVATVARLTGIVM